MQVLSKYKIPFVLGYNNKNAIKKFTTKYTLYKNDFTRGGLSNCGCPVSLKISTNKNSQLGRWLNATNPTFHVQKCMSTVDIELTLMSLWHIYDETYGSCELSKYYNHFEPLLLELHCTLGRHMKLRSTSRGWTFSHEVVFKVHSSQEYASKN